MLHIKKQKTKKKEQKQLLLQIFSQKQILLISFKVTCEVTILLRKIKPLSIFHNNEI